MTSIQLDHTAKVLAEMLTFKQPADAVLSAYFREHKKLGRQDRHEIAETAFAALRHYQKICAARMPSRAKPRLPRSFSAEAPTSAKSKTCSTKKKPSSSAA